MASGRTHEITNLTTLVALTTGYAFAFSRGHQLPQELLLAFAVWFLIGTYLITPDLDLAEGRVNAKTNWGILGLLWIPYGKVFSHRGWSHTWLVGPMTRLVYLAGVFYLLDWLAGTALGELGIDWNLRLELFRADNDVLWGAGAGYYLSQWMHLIADGIWPDVGRGRR